MDHILKCHPIVKTDFVRAQGSYLYDSQGRRYVDFEAGTWCTALGHNHPRMVRVIQEQMEKVVHLGSRFPNEVSEEAAKQVLDVVGLPDGKCVFLSSGSEAVEFGVQVARRISSKPLLLTLSGSYLAAYGSAGRKSPEEWYIFDQDECQNCIRLDICDPNCRYIKEIPLDHIGGLVFEPGNAWGTVRLPSNGLIRTLANLIRQQDGLAMVNEITTGMGRTGAWFGFQHYDIQPDIVAIGKGLGNGYPVSAAALSPTVAKILENDGFRYVQSHQNDPLGCAVAMEVIKVFKEERLVERSHKVGAGFLQELTALGIQRKIVKEARGRGLMIALEFAEKEQNISAEQIYDHLLDRRFLVGIHPVVNLLRFYPPLIIGEEDINQLLDNLISILDNLNYH
jgi:acetylornithine aminotransferase